MSETDKTISDAERKGRQEAVREFESACNYVALTHDHDSPQREIALKARSQMRLANGEAAS